MAFAALNLPCQRMFLSVSEDLVTNRQRAVAAFETIRSYAATRNELGSLTFRGGITGDQRQDQDRLIQPLAALRHHSDCVSGLRFDDATRTGRWQYDTLRDLRRYADRNT